MPEELRKLENPAMTANSEKPSTTVPAAIQRDSPPVNPDYRRYTDPQYTPMKAEDWIANRDIDQVWPVGKTLVQAEAALDLELSKTLHFQEGSFSTALLAKAERALHDGVSRPDLFATLEHPDPESAPAVERFVVAKANECIKHHSIDEVWPVGITLDEAAQGLVSQFHTKTAEKYQFMESIWIKAERAVRDGCQRPDLVATIRENEMRTEREVQRLREVYPEEPHIITSRKDKDEEPLTDIFRRGYQALAQLGYKTVDTLRGWVRKEEHLVAEVCKHSKGEPSRLSPEEYEAAVQTGRVGRVLAAAEHAPLIRVPQAFADQRKDIERLAMRLHGFGLGKAITTDNLRQVSPAQMRCLIDNARKLGFLGEGQGWATNSTAAKCIGRDLGNVVEKTQALDRGALR